MPDIQELIICECHSTEHQIIFRTTDNPYETDPEVQDEVYISIHLSNYQGFWKRLWVGLKYAFGYKCRYGHFDEIITTKQKLKSIINKL